MKLKNKIKTILPSILKMYDFEFTYIFEDDDTVFFIIKRSSLLSISLWYEFEILIKNQLDIKNISIIAYDEIEAKKLDEFINKSIYIERSK